MEVHLKANNLLLGNQAAKSRAPDDRSKVQKRTKDRNLVETDKPKNIILSVFEGKAGIAMRTAERHRKQREDNGTYFPYNTKHHHGSTNVCIYGRCREIKTGLPMHSFDICRNT